LAETILPLKPIDVDSREVTTPHAVRQSRELLRENERVKSGKVKLKTLEMGETAE